MTFHEWYAEAKTWQQGIGALMGFAGLMIAALWNFKLNRRRDAALREEEMKSVAAALYGEMRLLRIRAAEIARSVANVYIAQGTDARHSVKFDKHFSEAHQIPEPTLYKSLAPRFGLLPSSLLIPITSFYANVFAIGAWLPRMADDPTRGYTYGPLETLIPARDAVVAIVPTLRNIERLIGVPDSDAIGPLDLGKAEGLIDWEEEEQRSRAEEVSSAS